MKTESSKETIKTKRVVQQSNYYNDVSRVAKALESIAESLVSINAHCNRLEYENEEREYVLQCKKKQ